MVKAKDTVSVPKTIRKKRKELFPHGHNDCPECEQFVKETQAEITWPIAFKAGYDQGGLDSYAVDFAEGKRAGIREVVELLHRDIRREIHEDYEIVVFRLPGVEWQAKLKEWE